MIKIELIIILILIILINYYYIIMSDRYYLSCHVKVLHADNFLREKLLLHILL